MLAPNTADTSGEIVNPDCRLIAVLTYSSTLTTQEGGEPQAELTFPSRSAIDAGIIVYDEAPNSKIIIAGEHTFGHQYDSTSTLMHDYAVQRGIPKQDIVVIDGWPDENLLTTPKQVRAIRERYPNIERPISAVAHGFHLERVLLHARGYKVSMVGMNVSEILREAGVLDNYPELPYLERLANRERVIRFMSRFDRKGRLLNIAAAIQGPRLHDVIAEEDGSFKDVVSTSQKDAEERGLSELFHNSLFDRRFV